MMSRAPLPRFPELLAVLLIAAMAGAGWPSRSSAETNFDRTLSGDRVAIHNLVGTLRVVKGEGSSVTAEITLLGDDAGRLRLEQGNLRGYPTLRVVYPSDKIHVDNFGGRSQFWVRDDGTLDGKSGEGHKVELSGRGGLDASADITLRVPTGKRVDVFWGHGSGSVRGVDAYVSVDGASLSVAASDVKGDLRVSVGSGEVTVTHGSGEIYLETGSGDVTASDIDGDALKIETGSGAIQVSEIDLPKISLETGSGAIRAESIRAERASLETGSGSVALMLDSDVDMLAIESGSGEIEVSVPKNFGAEVSMETGSGSLSTEMPIEILKKSRNELHGTIGDGRGKLSLETGSGSIVLRNAK
jgi:lia operon protein LiaG